MADLVSGVRAQLAWGAPAPGVHRGQREEDVTSSQPRGQRLQLRSDKEQPLSSARIPVGNPCRSCRESTVATCTDDVAQTRTL